ncbi:MAG: porin family protein [Rubrivivax sp.]|nr:porin family protein [Pyrinomonadaceae bacterium]
MTLRPTEGLRKFPGLCLVAAALIASCLISNAGAQETLSPPKVEVKVTAGGASFGLDGGAGHSAVGGAVRIYLSKRWSVEPEFMYMRAGANDQDYFFTPSVAYDLTDPTGKYVPYLVGGVGVEHHRGRFVSTGFGTGQPQVFETSATTWSAGVGAGVKIFLTDRLFVAPEARIGREPTLRGTVSVGYVLSGRKRK